MMISFKMAGCTQPVSYIRMTVREEYETAVTLVCRSRSENVDDDADMR